MLRKWIKKKKGHIHTALQETHSRLKDTHRLKLNRSKKEFYSNKIFYKARVAILRQNIDLKTKTVTRDKSMTQ